MSRHAVRTSVNTHVEERTFRHNRSTRPNKRRLVRNIVIGPVACPTSQIDGPIRREETPPPRSTPGHMSRASGRTRVRAAAYNVRNVLKRDRFHRRRRRRRRRARPPWWGMDEGRTGRVSGRRTLKNGPTEEFRNALVTTRPVESAAAAAVFPSALQTTTSSPLTRDGSVQR